jgi:Protein of unknown function (DUF4232)
MDADMKQVTRGAAAAISLAILFTACGSQPVRAGHPVRHTALVTAAVTAKPCRAGDVWLGPGGYVSPMTGEHAAVFMLRNLGHASCALRGDPKVDLYTAAGHRLAFSYTDGHSMYFTSHRPGRVVLAAGKAAFFEIAKYRCDLGSSATATVIKVTLPGPARIMLTRTPVSAWFSFDYCKGGPRDPGQTIGISPIEPTARALWQF